MNEDLNPALSRASAALSELASDANDTDLRACWDLMTLSKIPSEDLKGLVGAHLAKISGFLRARRAIPELIVAIIHDIGDESVLLSSRVYTLRENESGKLGLQSRFPEIVPFLEIYAPTENPLENRTGLGGSSEPYLRAVRDSTFGSANEAAAYFLDRGPAITTDLWHDLALRRMLPLRSYVNEMHYAEFSPGPYAEEIEYNPNAEALLSCGPYCSWHEKSETAYLGHGVTRSTLLPRQIQAVYEWYEGRYPPPSTEAWANFWEEAEDRGWFDDVALTDIPAIVMGAAICGKLSGDLAITDQDRFESLLASTIDDFDDDFVAHEPHAVVGEPDLVGPRWVTLTTPEKTKVVENLLLANSHPLHTKWGTIGHLLSLILLHPETPFELAAQIKDAKVEGTQRTIDFLSSSGHNK
jgi:hypothetical protein